MFKNISIATIITLISLACGGGSVVTPTPTNPLPPDTPGQVSTYGFFRKLNPSAKASMTSVNSDVKTTDNPTVVMSTARSGHKAVQINDNTFMLIGGEIADGRSLFDRAVEKPSTIDYFDRVTETFTHKTNIVTNVSRHWYSGEELSFGVLRLPDGNILMVGGADTVKDTVEIFNPVTESIVLYRDVFPVDAPVNNIMEMFYMGNNKVLLTGCTYTVMPSYPQTIVMGNAVLDLLTMKASLIPTPVNVYRGCSVQVADGSVIIMGGIEQDNRTIHKDIWRVEKEFFTVSKVAEMSVERFAFGATLLSDGKVGIYGGVTLYDSYTKSVDVYDPADNSVIKSTDLPAPRNSLRPALLQNGFTLNAGGCEEGHLVATEIVHNHLTGVVGYTGNLTTGRRFFSTIALNNGRLLISGGDGGNSSITSLNTAEIYDPNTKIIISSNASVVNVGSTTQFTADKECAWAVTNVDPNNKNTGSISSSGIFTAPDTPTKIKITAMCSDASGYVIVTVIN